MAKFTLALRCDGAAFTPAEPLMEVGRILEGLGTSMRLGETDKAGLLWDVNGNKVGEWAYVEEAE